HARGDLAGARAALADRPQNREVEPGLAQLLADEQLSFLVERRSPAEHATLEIPLQRLAWLELLQVVRHAAQHREGAEAVLGRPARKECRRIAIAEWAELEGAGDATVGRAGEHVVDEEAD